MNNLGITLKNATLKKLHDFQVHTVFIGLSAVVSQNILFLSVSLDKETSLPWPILRLKDTTRIQIKNLIHFCNRFSLPRSQKEEGLGESHFQKELGCGWS